MLRNISVNAPVLEPSDDTKVIAKIVIAEKNAEAPTVNINHAKF